MVAKKPPAEHNRDTAVYERQLDYLYARRSILDTLIASLEEYERFPAQRIDLPGLKTA
jgi:hypothetical protein